MTLILNGFKYHFFQLNMFIKYVQKLKSNSAFPPFIRFSSFLDKSGSIISTRFNCSSYPGTSRIHGKSKPKAYVPVQRFYTVFGQLGSCPDGDMVLTESILS